MINDRWWVVATDGLNQEMQLNSYCLLRQLRRLRAINWTILWSRSSTILSIHNYFHWSSDLACSPPPARLSVQSEQVIWMSNDKEWKNGFQRSTIHGVVIFMDRMFGDGKDKKDTKSRIALEPTTILFSSKLMKQ